MISCSQHRVGRARKLKSGCEFPALLACFPLQAARKRSELRAVLMAPVARAVGLCRAVIGPGTTVSCNIVQECLFSSANDRCLCSLACQVPSYGMAFIELAGLFVALLLPSSLRSRRRNLNTLRHSEPLNPIKPLFW